MKSLTIKKKPVAGYKKLDKTTAKKILEEYNPAEVISAINSAFPANNPPAPIPVETTATPEDCCEGQYSLDGVVLTYIRKLEGYRIRLREFHWSTDKKAKHELTDDAIKKLESYEDEIAEDMQGILGIRIKVGDVIPILPDVRTSLCELIQEIIYISVVLKETLPDTNVESIHGIDSLLDELIHDFNKIKYLCTFD